MMRLVEMLSTSFNPCFRGTCSWCAPSKSFIRRGRKFQSLFSWNLLLMANYMYRPRCQHWFQSLFSWNLLLMNNPSCSNECLTKFQSLFSWNLLLMFIKSLTACSTWYCFNPCFRGTCSWCLWASSPSLAIRLVSILVFVELALDDDPVKNAEEASSFQSLFSWNLLLMHLGGSRHLHIVGVSILVFVELALDGGSRVALLVVWRSFNPCFRGTCSWCELSEDCLLIAHKFQSLFSWNLLLMFPDQLARKICYQVSILVFVELALDVCGYSFDLHSS